MIIVEPHDPIRTRTRLGTPTRDNTSSSANPRIRHEICTRTRPSSVSMLIFWASFLFPEVAVAVGRGPFPGRPCTSLMQRPRYRGYAHIPSSVGKIKTGSTIYHY